MNDTKEKNILAINPGSTSTKIAVYAGTELVLLKNIKHSVEELSKFKEIIDQYEFRKKLILKELENAGIDTDSFGIIVGRGGLLKPIQSGVYPVNDLMKEDLIKGAHRSQHASNLGGLIADDIAKKLPNAKAYIADPPVVDEMDAVARITGHPAFERKSVFHALNQKAVARKHAKSISKKYEEINLIVAHLGGGISIGAHRKGKVVDVNETLSGEGPFSPERSGTLPAGDLAAACFSGKYTEEEIRKMITGKGGYSAYLGTNDAREVEERAANKDEAAELVYDAMSYQVAKDIGAQYTVLKGEVEGIIITGGIAHDKTFIAKIIDRVQKLAPVFVYPGEDEMEALAMNGLMVLNNEIEILEYS
ncbi:MAG: butyrate kinase [bacterium]|nr:butyrate kinase [bacterium]